MPKDHIYTRTHTEENKRIKEETRKERVGFEVLTTVVMKSSIFQDITPCSPLKVNRRIRRPTSELKSNPSKISARGRQHTASKSCWFLAWVHGITPHRIEFFRKKHGLKERQENG
jgi:hypothetical protein